LAAAGCADPGRRTPLYGGDMGPVVRVDEVVVKHAPAAGARFVREAEGLQALAAAGVRVPEVLHAEAGGLVMRFVPEGPRDLEALGRMIAGLHRGTLGQGPHGWPTEVYLGRFAFPVIEGDVGTVMGEGRLLPLLRACWRTLGPLGPRIETWLSRMQWPEEGASLLHGDLWSGNVLHGAQGPVLIDPGVQRGERGLDLAMMELFGGFGGRCRAAYEEVWPVPDDVRRALPAYRLVYLLAHVHFFGSSYLDATDAALRELS
jgi:fructosamine-3-kinase